LTARRRNDFGQARQHPDADREGGAVKNKIEKVPNQIGPASVRPLSRMNGKTVGNPGQIMNALLEHWNGERIRAVFRSANASKLRYSMLVLTLGLLVAVVMTARQLVEGIFAAWPD
jgi:hypothetical protein